MLSTRGGYLVITGQAGFGKTALIANLLSRTPNRLAYHFFTRWYGADGLDERFFLQNVVEQLTLLQRRDAQIPDSIEKLRAMYHHLLTEAVDEPLVLVLDGLDEVSSWKISPYLSRHLPANIHVIVTVRDVGQDWATVYEIPPDQIIHLKLDGLSREELGVAFRRVGGQGVVLGDDDTILDQIVRVAAYGDDTDLGADPLFVRFLLEDAAAGSLTPESLARQPRGVSAYLDQWWEELKVLAGNDAALDFFGTLAAALGPMGRADLVQINPSLRLTGGWADDPFDTVLTKARRMIFGNDEEGYALALPRLRSYMRSKPGMSVYSRRIRDYCANWHEHKSSYALAYYPQHLLEEGQKEALYGLVSKPWIEARAQESTYQAPAADLRLVMEVARSAEPPNLTQEVRDSLIYATLGSFTAYLPPEAIHVLAQLGSVREARAFASLIQDDQSRIEAQIAVGTGLLARGESNIARSELRRAMRAGAPQNLGALAPAMARLGNFAEVSAALTQIGDRDLHAKTVADCVAALAGDGQVENALILAGTLDAGMPCIEVLADVARLFAEASAFGDALKAAEAALPLAESVSDHEARPRALALVARALARAGAPDRAGQLAAKSLAALAELEADWRLMETVCMAAQALAPSGHVEDALQSASRIAEELAASRAFVSTVPQVSGEYDLRRRTGSVHITTTGAQAQDSGASEFEFGQAMAGKADDAFDLLRAARLTLRNIASSVPDNGLILIRDMASADQVKANAVSWVAQSLAQDDWVAESLAQTTSTLKRNRSPTVC